MNDAHFHLLVNHFPIIGLIFGLGILIAGFILKNNTTKKTAYILFVICAIFSFLAMNTGEGAEEIVEDLPTIGNQIIHEHEEFAEKFAISSYILAVFSIMGFYFDKMNHSKSKLFSFLILIIAIITTILSQSVGTSGGEIRHTEIRETTAQTIENHLKNNENKNKN